MQQQRRPLLPLPLLLPWRRREQEGEADMPALGATAAAQGGSVGAEREGGAYGKGSSLSSMSSTMTAGNASNAVT